MSRELFRNEVHNHYEQQMKKLLSEKMSVKDGDLKKLEEQFKNREEEIKTQLGEHKKSALAMLSDE